MHMFQNQYEPICKHFSDLFEYKIWLVKFLANLWLYINFEKFPSIHTVMGHINVCYVFCKSSVLCTCLHIDDCYEELLAEADSTDSSGEVLMIRVMKSQLK